MENVNEMLQFTKYKVPKNGQRLKEYQCHNLKDYKQVIVPEPECNVFTHRSVALLTCHLNVRRSGITNCFTLFYS